MQEMLQKFKVLIAEDDPLVSESVASLLRQAGHSVIGCAYDGHEAVEMTKTIKPELVLMDINMPGIDGIEATRQIIRECPTPVVILTAYESVDFINRATKAGVAAYVVKPPRIIELNRVMTIAAARFGDIVRLETLNQQLSEALEQVKTLSGLIPICASCKKIRDDDGYWNQVDTYLKRHTDVEFTHGVCPACALKMYGEYIDIDDLA
jgi:AmiR/NasT family two-component response regulator